ncbi:sentrin-specific protease 2 [Vigna unguiculata]|uniref:Sentrin-specific protease 2 n=1 Tax=Vigna unguiculata TaxID=3917 RepID=A0A4D6N3W8_VIGUN|nr:sentrin-specific protease 2 [Vigna unguiculata]
MIKELGSNVSNIPHQELWKHARVNKAGEIENEDVQQVWNKCVILSQTIQSEEMSNARSDILAQALCVPEYPSRVRATGFGVNMAKRMAWMENEINSLRKKDTSNNIEEPDISVNSGQGSCTISSNSFPEGVSSCKLFVSSPLLCLVAHGKLHNVKGDTLHGRSLPNGHVKVSVDIPVEPNVSLPIPNADDDIMTIGQAIGTFVAWPINLLQVVDADSNLSRKKKINNTNESVAPKRKCQGKMIVQNIPRKVIHPNLPQWCNYLSSYMKLKPTESLSPIEIEKDIFGFDEHKEIINAEIIGEIIDYAWLGATTISIYIGYLYQNFIKPNHKGFFFLSPQITTHELPMKERMQKIVSIFLDNGVINKFVLAPINTGQHWVLLGINLKMEIIYYLDPLAKDINMRQDLKKLFDMVIQTYRAQRGSMVSKSKLSNIKWTPIKCPKQSNDHDCGYYICRYMKEIVTYCEGGTIPIDYFPSCRC